MLLNNSSDQRDLYLITRVLSADKSLSCKTHDKASYLSVSRRLLEERETRRTFSAKLDSRTTTQKKPVLLLLLQLIRMRDSHDSINIASSSAVAIPEENDHKQGLELTVTQSSCSSLKVADGLPWQIN